MPFAGHPSVGTAHAVLEAGLAAPQDGVLVQDGIAGQLPLRVEQRDGHRSIAIRTPRARVAEQWAPTIRACAMPCGAGRWGRYRLR